MPNVRLETVVEITICRWIQLFWRPKLTIRDQRTSFRGDIATEFLVSYGTMMPGAPPEAHNQVGHFEKQSHLLKI